MRRRDALAVIEYWRLFPPEHEMLALFARVYTTWEPAGTQPQTEEEAERALRVRQQRLWRSGQAMDIQQMCNATGGGIREDGGSGGPGGIAVFDPFKPQPNLPSGSSRSHGAAA